jgi:hypothetical protein
MVDQVGSATKCAQRPSGIAAATMTFTLLLFAVHVVHERAGTFDLLVLVGALHAALEAPAAPTWAYMDASYCQSCANLYNALSVLMLLAACCIDVSHSSQ